MQEPSRERRFCAICRPGNRRGKILSIAITDPGGRGVQGGAKPLTDVMEGDGDLNELIFVFTEYLFTISHLRVRGCQANHFLLPGVRC